MMKKIGPTLCGVIFSILVGAIHARAQVVTVPDPTAAAPDAIVVSFPTAIKAIDKTALPAPGGTTSAPLIAFKQGAARTFLTAETTVLRNGPNSSGQLRLSNFKTLVGGVAFDLVQGSTGDGGTTVPAVAPGQDRTYFITWEDVQLEGQGQGEPVLTSVTVGSAATNPPVFFVNSLLNINTDIPDAEKKFTLSADGVVLSEFVKKYRAAPGRIEVTLEFDKNDPVPGTTNNSIVEGVEKVEGMRQTQQPDGSLRLARNDDNPQLVIVTIGRRLPQRAEAYKAKFAFLPEDLNAPGVLKPGFKADVTKDPLSATEKIEANAPPTERAKTEFYFDATFTSIVNATNRKRGNVGLFALHFKPVVGLRFFNVGAEPGRTFTPEEEERRRPRWFALRPLFDADVDTQPIKDSQAPNRIVFGTDIEYGIAASRRGRRDAVQQYVFLNGVRYDSDRDFKTQTLYWQTEFLPQFLNFDVPREQRLRRFRRPCDSGFLTGAEKEACDKRVKSLARRFPLVSMYYVRPSVGYQLGGVLKRGDAESDNVSRLFVKFSTAVELKRLLLFSLDDTYYFLQDAERRRNRNYLETRLDFNTGALFNVDLGSLQSAITFKFQRGELPPRFKPVNALSVGFKIYR